jgi:hypothetical protein
MFYPSKFNRLNELSKFFPALPGKKWEKSGKLPGKTGLHEGNEQ